MGGREVEEHAVLAGTGLDGANTCETHVSLVPQPLRMARLLERGCTAVSGGASADGLQQAAADTLCSQLQASSPQCWCLAWKRKQKFLALLRVSEN